MSNDKYKLSDETIKYGRKTLYRIVALKDFGCIMAGTIGGFVEDVFTLSQSGSCWIDEDAKVFGRAVVTDNALVCNKAVLFGTARLEQYARVEEDAKVGGFVCLSGTTRVSGKARLVGEFSMSAGRVYSPKPFTLSVQPVTMQLQNYHVTMYPGFMQIGCERHTLSEWARFDADAIADMDGVTATKFWKKHRDMLLGTARSYGFWRGKV